MKQIVHHSEYSTEKGLGSIKIIELNGESYLLTISTDSCKYFSIPPKTRAIIRFCRYRDKGIPYKYPHFRASKAGRVFWCTISINQDEKPEPIEDMFDEIIKKVIDKCNNITITEGEAYWYPSFEQIPTELETILRQEGFYKI